MTCDHWCEVHERFEPDPILTELCPEECADGWIILNPNWPQGDLPHRERCPYVGDEDYRPSHPSFWSNQS